MRELSLINACVVLGKVPILNSVSFTAKRGQFVGLVGPNGAGKTTALRALLGFEPLQSGHALIGNIPAHTLRAKARALMVSYLPQIRDLAWPIGVREVVALGRYAHGGPLGRLGPKDHQAVDKALALCGLQGFAHRSIASLSGGEVARVHIARVMAAEAQALIADEPIAALDPRLSLDIMAILKAQAQSGHTVVASLHDLELAAQFCDDIIVLHQGAIVIQAPPRQALSPEILDQVYGINASWTGECLMIHRRNQQA
ncbi:ABC transporter ATP-binding protein [Candidatus Phycosocius spiralis]|uniref:ABC transporter n=1 Tax=Candidatus Phycosocius spiralis TaxID=2815099 RepID=A0ABQ4PYL3_9PROT|nr:ABC transporter ATP-binding protein [Candidatus Phycosocius spiralis]GIU68097.1 ABC transporter [Candidatus Phycosocius spiralis]